MATNDIYEIHGKRIILDMIGYTHIFFVEAISGRKSNLPLWYIRDYAKFIGNELYVLEA